MKRIGGLVAAGALGMGLASGCSAFEAPAPNPESNIPAQEQLLQDLQEYWTAIGVTGMGDVSLQTVNGREVTDCTMYNPATDKLQTTHITSTFKSPGAYCQQEQTVVISASGYNRWLQAAQKEGLNTEAVGAMILAHEVAHKVEDETMTLEASTTFELTADCLAGQSLQAERPELVSDVIKVYQSDALLGARSNTHGSRKDRLEAFQTGVDGRYGCITTVPTQQPA